MKVRNIILAIIVTIATVGMLGCTEAPQYDPFLKGEIVGIGRVSIEDSNGIQTDYPAVDIKVGDEKFAGIVNSTDGLKEGMNISFVIRRNEMIERTKNGEKFYGKLVRIVSIEPQSIA